MGLLSGVVFNKPNSLLTAILASQPIKTTIRNKSSNLKTTSLPPIAPILISGDNNIKNIRKIRAKSVCVKAVRNKMDANTVKISAKGVILEALRLKIKARIATKVIMARLIWLARIDIFLSMSQTTKRRS